MTDSYKTLAYYDVLIADVKGVIEQDLGWSGDIFKLFIFFAFYTGAQYARGFITGKSFPA